MKEMRNAYHKFYRRNGKPSLRARIIKRSLKRRKQMKLSLLFARLRAMVPQVTGIHIPNQRSGFCSALVRANNLQPPENLLTIAGSAGGMSSLPNVGVNTLARSNLLMIQIMTWKELGLLSSFFSVLENENLEVLSAQTYSAAESKVVHIILVKSLRTSKLGTDDLHSKLYSVAAGQAEVASIGRGQKPDQLDICKTAQT
jgi:hypothetical protein